MYNWLSVRDFGNDRHLQMYNWLSVRDFGNDQASSDVQLAKCTRFWQWPGILRCTIGLVYEILAMTRHLQMYNWLNARDFGYGQASSDVQLA